MKKPALLIIVLILTVIVLSVVRTFIANNIATSGVVLNKIEQQVAYYKLENSVLAEKLYTLSSLTNVYDKAYDLGYQDQTASLVLTQNQTVALNR